MYIGNNHKEKQDQKVKWQRIHQAAGKSPEASE